MREAALHIANIFSTASQVCGLAAVALAFVNEQDALAAVLLCGVCLLIGGVAGGIFLKWRI